MALELLSESWAGWPAVPSPGAGATSSPRISFSRDLDGSTTHPHHLHHQQRADRSLLDSSSPSSSPDFDFFVSGNRPEQEYSYAADEFFSDGFLLPLPILHRDTSAAVPSVLPSLPTNVAVATPSSSSFLSTIRPVRPLPLRQVEERKDSSEGISTVAGNNGGTEEKPVTGKQPTSFWKFGRSSSLNCSGAVGNSGGRRSNLICSLPLLSRSKSTGSHPSAPTLKQRQQSSNVTSAAAPPACSGSKLSRKGSGNGGGAARNPYYYGQHHQGGGGVRISPVLNVPPPYIPKGSSAGLFSFGHLLCSNRERSRKKTQQPTAPPQQSS